MKFLRHSPSSLNLFSASPSMFVLEKIIGRRQPMGAPAFRGTAVEDGVTAGLMDLRKPLEECDAVAFATYDRISALTTDKRREEFRADIPAMVKTSLAELRAYGTPSKCQGFVEWKPEGLAFPIVGYFDYFWEDHGIIVDLKTSDKMPSAIKISHSRQVALYAATISDNIEARVSYCTPKKHATYRLENTREHLNSLHRIALCCEKFLSLSDDPEFFKSITVPDLESFYWNGPAREIAYELWKI